jgi:hypothetical protein
MGLKDLEDCVYRHNASVVAKSALVNGSSLLVLERPLITVRCQDFLLSSMAVSRCATSWNAVLLLDFFHIRCLPILLHSVGTSLTL